MTTDITTATPLSIPTSTFTTTTTTNTNIKALIIVFLVTIIGVLKLKQRASFRKVRKGPSLPPGPTPWPILGNIPEMLCFKPTFRWIHQMMKDMNTDIACIRLGNTNIIPVTCPEIAREMLKKQDANFADRPLSVSAHAVSGGYMTAVTVPLTEQWKKMRKILVSEIVSHARHKWLHDKRAEESDNLVFYVHNQYKNNKVVNIRTATQHYCGNVVRKILFSRRYFGEPMKDGGPGPDEIKHVEAVFTALKYVYSFCVSDYLPFLRGLNLDGQEQIAKDANKTVRDYQNPIVDERYEEWRTGQRKEMEDLLDVFITLKNSDGKPLLTPDEVKNQAAEIMLAAVDNPSNVVEWVMAELMNQPELLKRAIEEIDRVVGKDRLVQESDIANLNYVKACARESFRLHPIAPFNLPHVAIQDTVVAGYFIPKGSHTILSRYGLGRNPKIWEDPLKYDPERHLKGQDVMLTEHDLRFVSFSTGRRGCIAALLGTCMTTMLLARLLQCFDWTLPDGASGFDLSEAENELLLANPLIASAKPRLAPHLYPTSN
ncbi:valine N-monooxygenase 1-like [Tripterygium wilfordii]|uniref:valine N-monooxygenase 1-like n=1 Tax=Tripterygium wilfordii TaxID=458696 RepID=UPI0018F837A6|nr:valine N-monooxygenase 1-like [Tripterygium wilfordii]